MGGGREVVSDGAMEEWGVSGGREGRGREGK